MAKDAQQDRAIHDLRQQIAHSRDHLARDLEGLRYELDFPRKFRKSFMRHTKLWVSAAVLTGVVVTARATTRKKIVYTTGRSGEQKKGEEQKKGILAAGLAMGALRFAATLLRPVVVSAITRKMGSMAGTAARSRRW